MASIDQIFKAYDIRGKVGSELTPEITHLIGVAFGDWLPTKGAVCVGRDMRPDSKKLADGLIAGLVSVGRDVIDIGEVTSDMIYFAVGHYQLAGGAVITASHNPGDYNGIKFCGEEAKPIGENSGLFEIRDAIKSKHPVKTSKPGSLKQKNVTKDWIVHVLSFVETSKLKPLKIAVDAGNGMAGNIFPELEAFVPFDVIEMYFELDGTFPNHIANPLDLKNLVALQQMVKDKDCDAGLAFDGDGDRAVLVDEKGEALSGSVMTALLAQYFLHKYPGSTILYNAICGRMVPETIIKAGGNPVRTRVGHSFIKSDMRKYQAVFAGEHSGHYYFKENFMADSGLIAALIGLYILSVSNKKLSELVEEYKRYVMIPEANFEIENKTAVINKLRTAFNDGKQDELDGLTVNYPDYWFNVRSSNTEPVIRLNAEAKTKDQLDALVAKVSHLITD